MKTFVAISGSLKSTSTNTSILKFIIKLASHTANIELYLGLDDLPHFSPERDSENPSEAVENLRKKIKNADGVIFCTPEYAFNLPGVLKNALDWCVSSGEFNEKPVLVLSASPLNTGGEKALASLQMTLTALGTKQVAAYSIANVNSKMNSHKELTDSETIAVLEGLLSKLDKFIENYTPEY
ncbi:MAG: NAD(P)H-dependent oxidoreductase [Sporocytophaga sp.]|uniref:NADPH-dependent FMN reductase n=1 Tax=Sporocytophaga sp. TaxID=2231183 RepID=UPI001B0CC266|nr:NADPH-dependent FMN reductase [Sporocytophaga sp.]MBO9698683.1 NAD(P)H-dependent oxidoreductase [Sporocytophaga sp.]